MKLSKTAIVALGASLLIVPLASAQTKAPDAPSRTFKRFSVVIDAGHGGTDPGGVLGKVAEKDVTLSLALKLRAQLEQKGMQVVLTRPINDFLPLQERVDIVNKIHPDCFISLHGATQKKPFSFQVNYYSPSSLALAQTIDRDLARSLHLPSQRPPDVQRFFVLRKSTVPAVMVTADLSSLAKPEEQQNFAVALAKGIEDYAQTGMAANKAKLANELRFATPNQEGKTSDPLILKGGLLYSFQPGDLSPQPSGSSPMLLQPDSTHTYSIPNARQSLPKQPAPTAMARKPQGPYNFMDMPKP